MSELSDHVALLQRQRTALSGQIAQLHDGDRKANLRVMLADIDDQIARIARASAAPAKTKQQLAR